MVTPLSSHPGTLARGWRSLASALDMLWSPLEIPFHVLAATSSAG